MKALLRMFKGVKQSLFGDVEEKNYMENKGKRIRMSELKDGQAGRVVGGKTRLGSVGHLVINHKGVYVEMERPHLIWENPEKVMVERVLNLLQASFAIYEEIHEGE